MPYLTSIKELFLKGSKYLCDFLKSQKAITIKDSKLVIKIKNLPLKNVNKSN
jgi:hypothetical protein